ncbi:MAG: hypothetical protein JNL83_38140 [Myxococcales bacterium]|nr:hypothetical protein [Myxococcales bacterium]
MSLRGAFAFVALSVTSAAAQEGPPIPSDSFDWRAGESPTIDGGLVVGFPTALPTGMSKGLGGGVTFGDCPLRWGARAAWVTATESTAAWEVTHSDLRLRLTGSAQHDAGRGSLGVRLGAGGTLVHESRVRNQGERAGLMGDALATSAFAFVPAVDLEAVVGLHVIRSWLVVVSGGPSLAIVDGAPRWSWTAQLGVAWRR